MAAGQLTGPTLGGLVLDLTSWRGIFLFNMSMGIILAVAQHFWLRGEDERHQQTFDAWGALLLLVGYPALLLALSVGPHAGWVAPSTLGWFAVGAVGIGVFFWWESRFAAPLFHLRFFRSGLFCVAMFTLAVGQFVIGPVGLFTPLYLQKVLFIDPFMVGLLMMALPISTVIAGPVGGRLSDKYNARLIAAAGALVLAGAVVAYLQLGVDSRALYVVVPLVLVGVGSGFLRPASQVVVYAGVDRRDYGALSAMLASVGTLAGNLGTTMTIAITESRASVNDPSGFADAVRFTFALLLPLLLLSVVVSLEGRFARTPEPVQEATPVGR
jgi:MFS family permease